MGENIIQYIDQDLYQEFKASEYDEFQYNMESDSSLNAIKDVYSKLDALKNSHDKVASSLEGLCNGVYKDKTEICSELRNFGQLIYVNINKVHQTMDDMTEALKKVLEEQVESDDRLLNDLQSISDLLGDEFDASKYSSGSGGAASSTTTTTMPDGTTVTTGTVEAAKAMAEPPAQEIKTITQDSPSRPAPNSNWNGPTLTKRMGVNQGPSGKETYYNLPMDRVVENMHNQGFQGNYWVREDGVKMFGDYVMVAANLDVHPRGSIVESSLGPAIVCDTGGFAAGNPNQLDIATSW